MKIAGMFDPYNMVSIIPVKFTNDDLEYRYIYSVNSVNIISNFWDVGSSLGKPFTSLARIEKKK